ncbi:MAG TPA: tetratricopeptide repeat protein [Vicinamibacterales bacterium]|nr:tetratricopeptide repeat protein [Vicinamibacterales bacterium]
MSSPLDRFVAADAILRAALDRPPDARREYVARACAGDADLRASVDRLLAAAEHADNGVTPGGAVAGALWDDLAATLAGEPPEIGPGARLGPYEVVALVGEGGMGRVYRARDPRLGRDVALKVLTASRDGRISSERFGREARAASALNHPNIVTIYDIGDAAGIAFIAMEYLTGGSVRERLAVGRLPLDEALDLAGQVAQGLAAAHARGVIHRDLKPGNIMMTAEGSAKIVDFGLAKLEMRTGPDRPARPHGEPLTAAGAIFGTAPYMSPEQASGRPADYRSDLFSFGALLYEMVTGQRPFERGSAAETVAAILKEQPPPASALNPLVPPPLEWAIDRCLAKDAANRYESTRDLARDLKAVREYRARLRPVPPAEPAGDLRCPACGALGERDRRFCDQCGTEFRRRCPGCGNDVAPQAAFCSTCGQRLSDLAQATVPAVPPAPSGDALLSRSHEVMSGERRHVTILASRISGYEALVERAAPEDVDRVLAAFETGAKSIVERFGGVVDRVSGEEMVALFGIPVAHEDDARRAARAALALHARFRQDARRAEIQLRSAVHTGPVIVRAAADRPHGVRVLGEALSDAMGLLRVVRDGDVLVSHETQRLAGAALRAESIGPVQVRSDAPPLATYRVTAGDDSSAPPLESTDVPLTPFAGRQGELGALAGSVEMAIAGEGQVVTVIGDAGAGKSRLLHELRRQIDRDRIALAEGRCQSYGARVPYLPLVQCCRSVLRVRDGGSADDQRRQVRERLRALDRELEGFLPIFFELLSITNVEDLAPKVDALPARHAVQEALAGLFSLASRRRPLLMLLEDWHWVDEASHDVIRQLADVCPSFPLMVVITYRPDVRIDWGSLRHIRATHLTSLGPVSSGQIIRAVLGADRVAEPLAARLHERSGGNPFFLEEVCRKLLEEGAVRVEAGEARVAGALDGLHLPDSVQAVIRARLDRLDRDARDLLRRASVIGREFTASVLAAVAGGDLEVDPSLATLKERGLIRQTSVVPEPAYRFQHALTQEVAYDSLLQRQRQILHGQVGAAIESVYKDHLHEQYGILARHFAEAEHWPKAVEYGRRSARRARHLSQFDDARAALDMTMEWTLRLPEDEARHQQLVELLFEKEQVCEVLGDRAQQQETIDRLLAILEPGGDRKELSAAYARQAELLAAARRFAEGERLLDQALAVSRRLGDRGGERDTLRSLSFLLWLQRRNDEALDAVDRALELDREAGDPARIAGDLTNRGAILRSLGRFDEAIGNLQEALGLIATESEETYLSRHVEAMYVLHTVYRDKGDPQAAEPLLARALEISSEDRFRVQMPFPMSATANLLLERGEIERALDLFRRAVELGRQSRYAFGLAHNLRGLAEVLVGIGRVEEALPYLREAADLARRLVDRDAEIAMLAQAAPLLEQRGQNEEAAQSWQRLLDLTREDGRHALAVRALTGLARAAEHAGHGERALRFLCEALPLCEDEWRGHILNEIGIREWRREQFEPALDRFREALSVFERLGHGEHIGLMLNSIGSCLARLGRVEEAQATLEGAVGAHAAGGHLLLEGHALALLGDVARAQRDTPRAVAAYEQSLVIRQRLGDRRGEGWMRHHLARACHEAGLEEQARQHATRAAAIGGELGDGELVAACQALALVNPSADGAQSRER